MQFPETFSWAILSPNWIRKRKYSTISTANRGSKIPIAHKTIRKHNLNWVQTSRSGDRLSNGDQQPWRKQRSGTISPNEMKWSLSNFSAISDKGLTHLIVLMTFRWPPALIESTLFFSSWGSRWWGLIMIITFSRRQQQQFWSWID